MQFLEMKRIEYISVFIDLFTGRKGLQICVTPHMSPGRELIGVVRVCLYILCALWWICVESSHWGQCVYISMCSHRVKSSSSSLFCLSCLGWVMLAQLGRDCSKRLMSSSLAQDALMVNFSSHCTIPLQHTHTHYNYHKTTLRIKINWFN